MSEIIECFKLLKTFFMSEEDKAKLRDYIDSLIMKQDRYTEIMDKIKYLEDRISQLSMKNVIR